MGIQHEAKMSCFAVLRILGLQGIGPNVGDWEMQGNVIIRVCSSVSSDQGSDNQFLTSIL